MLEKMRGKKTNSGMTVSFFNIIRINMIKYLPKHSLKNFKKKKIKIKIRKKSTKKKKKKRNKA